MAERTSLTTYRNSDLKVTYQFPSGYNMDGFSPVFYFRSAPGEAPLLTVTAIASGNGSDAVTRGDTVVLTLKSADLAVFGAEDIYNGVYDSNLPKDGFVNKFVGGPHTQYIDGSYGDEVFSDSVFVEIGGREVPVILESGNIGVASSVLLADLNAAVLAAEAAETAAETAAAEAVMATVNKLDKDGLNYDIGFLNNVNALDRIGSNVSNAATLRTNIGALGFSNGLTWNDGGTVFTALDFSITNTASQLTSNLLNFTVTGTNPSQFYVDRRANIYASGTSFRLGTAVTPGTSGNIHVAGSDIIIRGDTFGGGHTVFDGRFARGTAGAPMPALVNDQLVAFAVRSWDGADYITTGDITWGASQNHGVGQTGTDLTLWNVLNFTDDLFAVMRFTGLGVANIYCPTSNEGVVRTGVNYISFLSNPTVGAGVTAAGLRHIVVNDPGIGAGGSISSTHTAFEAPDFTSGTNKIAFRSNMAAAADKWALFLGGGAQSYIGGNVGIFNSGPAYPLDVTGDVNSTTRYRVAGVQVVSAQGAAVANGVNAAAAPTQAEFNALVTQFNLLLARLRTHGLIAT